MTVQTSTNVAGFVGNGVTTSFPIAFKFNSSADLIVEATNTVTGVTTTLSLNSDYTVAGAGDENGGTIAFTAAPLSTETVKVTRHVDLLQLTDLRNQGKFYAEVHEDVFDKLVMIDQQQQTEINTANDKSDEALEVANAASGKSDQAVAKADQNLVDMQAQYDAFEQGASLVVIGDYAAGLVVDAYNKVFRKDGEFYRAKAALTLPYPLNGAWAVDAPNFVSVGDAVLRQELANGGSTLVDSAVVGFSGPWASASERTVQQKMREIPSVDDFEGATDKERFERAIAACDEVRMTRDYTFSGVVVNKPITLIGAGSFDGAVTLTNPTADEPFFDFQNASGISISGFKATSSVARTGGAYFKFTNCNRIDLSKFFIEKYFLGFDFDGGSEITVDRFQCFNSVFAVGSGAMRFGNTAYTGCITVDNGYIKNEDPAKQASFGIQARYVDVMNLGAGLTIILHGNAFVVDPGAGQIASLIDSRGTVFDTSDNGIVLSPTAGGKILRCDFAGAWSGEHSQNCVVIDGAAGLVSGVKFIGGDFINGENGFNVFGASAQDIRISGAQVAANTIGVRAADGANLYIDGGTIGAYGDAVGNVTGIATDGTCSGKIQQCDLTGNATPASGSFASFEMFDNDGIDNWKAYSPAVSAQAGVFGSVSSSGRYVKRYQRVTCSMSVTITTNGTAAGAVFVTLPFPARVSTACAGRASGVSGKALQGFVAGGSDTVAIYNYDGSYPGGDGEVLVLNIDYEIQ